MFFCEGKAQLVAKGFEEIYNEKILKDSPTCSKEAVRIILTLIAQKSESWMPLISKLLFCKEKKLIEKFLLCHPKKQKQMFGCWKNVYMV